MSKEAMSPEELDFLVRRNKEMDLSQMMTEESMDKMKVILKKSLNSIEQYVENTLGSKVNIDLLKYELINGRQSLAIIFEDELYVSSFEVAGSPGKHFLLTSKTQFQHFSEYILKEIEEERLSESLNRGLDVFYQSLGEQLEDNRAFRVENVLLSSWKTEQESSVVDLEALYEAKRYAIEYGDQILFIIHLTEVEFMEKIYENLGDETLEQQSMMEFNQQNKNSLSGVESTSQSNVNVRRPLFCAFDDVQTPSANHNLELLYDVPLEITVVLGKTKRSIQEILEINVGKIIELNQYADDPLEIYCNGKLIAEGEVVVVDDNFGIKVTKLHQAAMNKIKQ